MAINTHHSSPALEPEGHGDESVEEVLNEIVTGKPSHSETTTEEELNHDENIKFPIQIIRHFLRWVFSK